MAANSTRQAIVDDFLSQRPAQLVCTHHQCRSKAKSPRRSLEYVYKISCRTRITRNLHTLPAQKGREKKGIHRSVTMCLISASLLGQVINASELQLISLLVLAISAILCRCQLFSSSLLFPISTFFQTISRSSIMTQS